MITWSSDVPLEELRAYQLKCINEQVFRLFRCSRRYRSLCGGTIETLDSFSDFENLPFLSSDDIISAGTDMVCVPQREIRRIVSLKTSGTENVKRIYFTFGDIERNISFFDEGMRPLCTAGDTVMIFMPGAAPDGISGQLSEGLSRFGAIPVRYGLISDYGEAALRCSQLKPNTIVGLPVPVRRLALTAPEIRPRNVLLSADYVSPSVADTVSRVWGCEVYLHYGLTESCYGFAVECPYHSGMHIRNDEFYVEIIDPSSGLPLPCGEEGIITFTTLRREAMPLVRYRTGDVGYLTEEPCGCGSKLPRLARVSGREKTLSRRPNINEIDDILFALDDVLDYRASYGSGVLSLELLLRPGAELCGPERVLQEKYEELTIQTELWTGEQLPGKRALEYRD